MPSWALTLVIVLVCVAVIVGTRVLRSRLIQRARENGDTPDRSLPKMAIYVSIGAILFIAGIYLLTTR